MALIKLNQVAEAILGFDSGLFVFFLCGQEQDGQESVGRGCEKNLPQAK